MKIKAIILFDDILFDSFEQLQEHHKTIQALPEAPNELYKLTALVETEKGGFSKRFIFSKEALLYSPPFELDMIVLDGVDVDKVYQAGPPFETEIPVF